MLRRFTLTQFFYILIVLVLLVGIGACTATPATTAPTTSSPTTATPTTAMPTTTSSPTTAMPTTTSSPTTAAPTTSTPTTTSPATATPTTTAPAETMPPTVEGNVPADAIYITAENLAFDQQSITVETRATVSIVFTNLDKVPHNVAFYRNSKANSAIYVGEIITGPKAVLYQFTAPLFPGVYYFQCDVHPATMNGDFVVIGTAS